MLRPTQETKAVFTEYFETGLGPAEAIRSHEESLSGKPDGPLLLANGSINPISWSVYYWHEEWRAAKYGPSGNPLPKLLEKMDEYAAIGTDVSARSLSSDCWAVLAVTPNMRRAQRLESAQNIIFVDSTSSCDADGSTATVLLTSTKAGAVPIAVLVHSSQSRQGYVTAFQLLKQRYPFCFGDKEEVRADVGLCTCWVGRQGAFCKHQALVQQNFGGPFPNRPALTQADCRDLGHLALGDQCPPAEFFGPFGSFQHNAPSTHPGPSKTQARPISVEAMEVAEEVPSSNMEEQPKYPVDKGQLQRLCAMAETDATCAAPSELPQCTAAGSHNHKCPTGFTVKNEGFCCCAQETWEENQSTADKLGKASTWLATRLRKNTSRTTSKKKTSTLTGKEHSR
ncbi:hypothetical protein MTO96_024776 [Rhipicephalus appendiculatus]